MRQAPWWQFWNPMSGFAGGAIAGTLIATAIVIYLAKHWS
jgi:hypothetical protein